MPDTAPTGIAALDDGTLWFGLFNLGQIGRVQLAAAEPTRTATPVVTATAMLPPITPTALGAATVTPTGGPAACAGDCDGNGRVAIAELVAAVNIALRRAAAAACAATDTDRDGSCASTSSSRRWEARCAVVGEAAAVVHPGT